MDFYNYFMEKVTNENTEEEKTCKNCFYYLFDEVCVNCNSYGPFELNPPYMKNCPLWVDKEKGDYDIPF